MKEDDKELAVQIVQVMLLLLQDPSVVLVLGVVFVVAVAVVVHS